MADERGRRYASVPSNDVEAVIDYCRWYRATFDQYPEPEVRSLLGSMDQEHREAFLRRLRELSDEIKPRTY